MVALVYRSCEGVKFITGNIDDLLQDTELQETIKALRTVTEKLKTLKGETGQEKEDLLIEKNKYLSMVEQHKKKMISIVESLEKSAVEEINVWYNERKGKLREVHDTCGQLERDATTISKELDPPSDNKPQVFVSMKKGQKVLKAVKNFDDEKEVKSEEEYEINPDVEKHLSSIQSFGSFKKKNHLYKTTSLRKINVKLQRELECDITDTCFLADGPILVADWRNKNLKRLDRSTGTVTDQCDLPGKPWAVCCVGPHEVAVGLLYRDKMQFVSIRNKLKPSRSFDVPVAHSCRGICFSDGKLFVSDNGQNVFVYNMTGTLLRTISQTLSGKAMFNNTRHLALSGDRVYIVDESNGFICTDKQGRELYRYSGTQVKDAWGVCTDGRGRVFLCGRASNNVVQVGPDGEDLGVVLTEADGLNNPQSVCFDSSSQTLIVTNFCSEEILLFNLE